MPTLNITLGEGKMKKKGIKKKRMTKSGNNTIMYMHNKKICFL